MELLETTPLGAVKPCYCCGGGVTGDVGTQNSGLRRGTVLQSSLSTAGLEP